MVDGGKAAGGGEDAACCGGGGQLALGLRWQEQQGRGLGKGEMQERRHLQHLVVEGGAAEVAGRGSPAAARRRRSFQGSSGGLP